MDSFFFEERGERKFIFSAECQDLVLRFSGSESGHPELRKWRISLCVHSHKIDDKEKSQEMLFLSESWQEQKHLVYQHWRSHHKYWRANRVFKEIWYLFFGNCTHFSIYILLLYIVFSKINVPLFCLLVYYIFVIIMCLFQLLISPTSKGWVDIRD